MQKKFARLMSIVLFIGLIAGMLGGCTTNAAPTEAEVAVEEPAATTAPTDAPAISEPTATAEPAPTHEPVTLKVWIMDRVGADAMAAAKTVIQAWADETGNVVEITEGAQFEMMNEIPVAIPAGEGPDVFMTINSYIGQHYVGSLISPLEDAIATDELANYTQGGKDAFSLDGHLLGIPLAADVNALVYNKDLMPEPPQTMEELVTMSKELTSGDSYGFLYTIDAFWYSFAFVAGYGGYIFNWDGANWDINDVGLDNEGAIEGLQYVRDLVAVEGLMPADVTWDVMNSMFSSGQAAMTISNPTMVPTFIQSGINVGVTRIPQLANGKYPAPFATYTGVSVSAYSEHQAEAKALAVYMGANLPDPLYTANNGNIPVYQPALDSLDVSSDPMLAGWISQLESSIPLPSINEMNYVWGPAGTAFTSAVHGDATPADAMKAAQEQILTSIKDAAAAAQ